MRLLKGLRGIGFALALLALVPTAAAAQYCTHVGDCSMSVVGTVDIPIGAKVTIQCDWSTDANLCCQSASPIVNWGDGHAEGLDGLSGSRTVDHWYERLGNYTITFTLREGNQFCAGPVLCEKTSNVSVVPCDLSGCNASVDHIVYGQGVQDVFFTLVDPRTNCADQYKLWVEVSGGSVGCYAGKCLYELGIGPGPFTIDQKYYYSTLPEEPFTANFRFFADQGSAWPDAAECTTTRQVSMAPPAQCLNPNRDGGIQFCADVIIHQGETYLLQGHVYANDMLYFTGNVTIEGPNAPRTGVLKTDGDIYVKLQKGNEILLKGPGLIFDMDGPGGKLWPKLPDPKVKYFNAMGGVPTYVTGLPITLQSNGVVTESTFYLGVLDQYTLASAKATQLYPPGGKRTLLSAEVVAVESSIAPSIKFMSMSLAYDPDLDKLEGKLSVGFPFFDKMWGVDLAVRVVQGCFNGLDLTIPYLVAVPLGTSGFELAAVTVKMDNICVGQFWIFFGGDLNIVGTDPLMFVIKDVGLQYIWPFSLELKAGTASVFGYPMAAASGRVNANSQSGTFKVQANVVDFIQGDLRFDLIVPRKWFMGRFYGKVQIPDFQCAWTSVTCRTLRALITSMITLPYVIDEQSLECNAQILPNNSLEAFFRGLVTLPFVGKVAFLAEVGADGERNIFLGRNMENLYEVTEYEPLISLGPESAEKSLVLSQDQEVVVFSAAADAVIPSIYLRTPSGSTITPATVSSFPGVTYASSDAEKVALFRVENAVAGTWTLGVDNLSADQIAFQALCPKAPPATAFTSVDQDSNSVSIAASVTPASANTTVTLLYSQSNDGSAEGIIAQDLPATSGTVTATWDTSAVPTGTYFILARTDDGVNPPLLTVYQAPLGVDQGQLLPPTGVTGTRNGTSATLSWAPSSSPAVKGYSVLFTDNPQAAGYPYSLAAARSDGTILDKLDEAKGYRLCVVAYDEEGNLSPQSNSVAFATPGSTPGDCDGSGTVSIGEVQKAINMFLGSLAPACSVDASGDGTVSIGEVQKVINAFLGVIPGVSVSVSPSTVTVLPNVTQQFTATVTGSTNTAVTWSVQEGSAGGNVNASGLYTAPSTAGICHVKATSQADPSKSGTATVTVTQAPTCTLMCSASASPASGQAPLAVTFTATATPSNCSGGATYAWNFGDGGTSTQQNASHAYAAAGAYTWTLTASADGVHCSQSGSVTVTSGGDGMALTSGAPVNDTITGANQNGSWNYYYLDIPDGVTGITVDIEDPTGDVDLYVRGGEKPDLSHYDCRSWEYGPTPEHCAAPLTGPQRVWIGVTNYLVGTSTYTITATAGGSGDCAIEGCFAIAAADGLVTTFTSEYHATGCSGTPGYLWQFGDGTLSMEPSPVHTYASPGTYTWSFSVGIQDQTCGFQGDIAVTAQE